MSTMYKRGDQVPTEVLAKRLDELADAVGKKGEERDRALTRRIPAELDRDADLVLSEASTRLMALEGKCDALAAHARHLSDIAEKLGTASPEYLAHLAAVANFVLLSPPGVSLSRLIARERADAMDWVLAQATNEENERMMWRKKIVMPEIDRLRLQAQEPAE